MTIGFDASRAFIEGKTGTENYSYQLLKALAKIDTENDYLIYLRPGNYLEVSEVTKESKESDESNVKKPSIPSSRLTPSTLDNWPRNFRFKVLNYPRLWTQIGLAKATFEDELDVLFVPSHTLPLIRKPGLKTIITVHDLGAEYLPGMHQLKQALYLKLMTNYQLKTATKIIAVSKATKIDLMKKIGIPGEKIEVVYEGVDRSVFKRSLRFSATPAILKPIPKDLVNDIVKKYDLERGKYFLFVGTIQPRKNLERLIKAFSVFSSPLSDLGLPVVSQSVSETEKQKTGKPNSENRKQRTENRNYKLVLVGAKGWKSDSIYRLPKELGIETRVKFLPPQGGRVGRIPDSDLVGLYNGATALTYPSLFEGFGLPILEAMACGCPVITSNVSSMPEVAGGGAVLVDPQKKEDIAKAMVKLVQDDAFRNTLIKKGYNRVKDFDWKKTAVQTLKVLKETVKSYA